MKISFCLFFFFLQHTIGFSQELFVFTEPASNMPSHTTGFRLTGMPGLSDGSKTIIPEVMYAVSKKLMVHAEGILGWDGPVSSTGIGVYAKYRFYSDDAVHQHFRIAVYARAATNNAVIRQQEISLTGRNSGL